MTMDFVTDLNTNFAYFKERGISRIQVENFILINNRLEDVSVSFY